MPDSARSLFQSDPPAPEDLGKALQTLSALANEQRLMILCLLARESEMTVGQLHEKLSLSQSALSQHSSSPVL